MSLEYTCLPKCSHDTMRCNSTARKGKLRLQLALDVFMSAIPHISLTTELLIELVEENNYQGCSQGKTTFKGQKKTSQAAANFLTFISHLSLLCKELLLGFRLIKMAVLCGFFTRYTPQLHLFLIWEF